MTPSTPATGRSGRGLGRRLAYALAATALVFVGLTALLAGAERLGWLDSFSQDDAMLYLQGKYLTVDTTSRPARYEIRDPQDPAVIQTTFPAHKRRGAFRVFLTGGSFMHGGHHVPPGTPVLGYGTIPDWVREILEMRYPSMRFEVVNAAANGQGAYRIATVVRELVHADPDLIVVATGNNEGSVPVTGVSRELNDWILYRLLKKAVREEPTERPAYPLQELGREQLGAAFAENVGDMVVSTREAGVPLALATLPLNLVQMSETVSRDEITHFMASDPACSLVENMVRQRRCDVALDAGTRCPQAFFVALRTADCLRSDGRLEEAAELYRAAIQLEPRGRTRPSYNQTLRDAASQNGLVLVDLEKVMEERSRPGLSGSRDFIDSVHLTCMGYLPMAAAIVDGIVASGMVPAGRGEPLPTPTAAELLERYPWDTSGYTPPASVRERTARVCSPDPAFR